MIDWVVQMDIPDTIENYVHRVGRTARYKHNGSSLIFVGEGERDFINLLKEKEIPVHRIMQNPTKYFKIESSLRSMCTEHGEIKYLAQKN